MTPTRTTHVTKLPFNNPFFLITVLEKRKLKIRIPVCNKIFIWSVLRDKLFSTIIIEIGNSLNSLFIVFLQFFIIISFLSHHLNFCLFVPNFILHLINLFLHFLDFQIYGDEITIKLLIIFFQFFNHFFIFQKTRIKFDGLSILLHDIINLQRGLSLRLTVKGSNEVFSLLIIILFN